MKAQSLGGAKSRRIRAQLGERVDIRPFKRRQPGVVVDDGGRKGQLSVQVGGELGPVYQVHPSQLLK